LEVAVGYKLAELNSAALKFQQEGVADEKVDKNVEAFQDLQNRLAAKTISYSDLLVKLNQIIKEVRKHRSKASGPKKEAAAALLARADRLEKQTRARVDRTPTETKPERGSQTTSTQTEEAGSSDSSGKKDRGREAKSLTEVFREVEWSELGDYQRLIDIIDDALVTILGSKSEKYQMIVSQVEAQLQEEFTQ
jgi:hypothetical protein